MSLHGASGDPEVFKVVLAAELSGTKKKPAFSGARQTGKRLALVVSDDVCLDEPNGAARYYALQQKGGALLGEGATRWVVESWLDREECARTDLRSALTGGYSDADPWVSVTALLEAMNGALQKDGFLAEGAVSLADVVLWCALYAGLAEGGVLCGTDRVKAFPNVVSWFAKLGKEAAFETAIKNAGAEGSALAVSNMLHTPSALEKPTKTVCETLLPIPGQRNIMVTSALPYVNNVPHLGNLIGCVLSADVYARFCRLRGHNVVYVCGTDEYGTATETKALEEGVTPKEICDKYHAIHDDIYKWFDIKFDKFGRTSTDKQTVIAQDIFHKVMAQGNCLEDVIEQLYCVGCKRYLADRFVRGICPHCKYEDARGDQCDGCGKLLNTAELIEPKCHLCKARPETRQTEHLFIDLPKIAAKLEEWVAHASVNGEWSANSIQVTKAWIRDGLKPRCITRDLKWGTPVPHDKYKDKVFYVWFDAPIGYISITAGYSDEWELWWKNQQEVQLYQFMGKDNIPFHTVIFPCSLIGSGDPYTMLHHISVTEYLNYEDGKFSKSRGVGVFGDNARDTLVPSEVWRYYLLANRPEVSDTTFTWSDFQAKNNSELLANLGNFVNRAITFTASRLGGLVTEAKVTEVDRVFMTKVSEQLILYVQAMEKVKIKEGIKIAMAVSSLGNGYMQDNKPWELLKKDTERCGTVINLMLNLALTLAALVEPFMPSITDKILEQLNWPAPVLHESFQLDMPAGHKIGTPFVLFKEIKDNEVEEFRSRYGTKSNEFDADLRVGEIKEVKEHPAADKLFIMSVDIGTPKPRQICAGLRGAFTAEQLVGRKGVFVCNLKTAKLVKVESQGMMLCAVSGPGQFTPLEIAGDAPNGQVILPSTCTPGSKKSLNRKDFEKIQANLTTGPNGTALFRTFPFITGPANTAVTAPGTKEGTPIC